MSDPKHPSKELEDALRDGRGPSIARYILTILAGGAGAAGAAIGGDAAGVAGSVATGAITTAATAWSEHDQARINSILQAWLKLQEDEIREIGATMTEVMSRLDLQDEHITERLQSPEYLRLIKKCFRDWSAAESEEKRILIRNLLINAAGDNITTDDIVRLFVSWIDTYSEAHFKVVRAIYNHSGITRRGIWLSMNESLAREDSPEADLFKLLVHDLTTGHIIRQHRQVDAYGNFVPNPPTPRGSGSSRGYTSAFDDQKQYELTQLGQQFVHYTMSEYVTKIASPKGGEQEEHTNVPGA